MYDWERCDHRGIGQIGCPVCDFDKGRVMIRQQRLDNRDLRALNAELRETAAEMSRWLSRWRPAIKIHADGVVQAWDELERLHNKLAKGAK
jgi:hypothetical protein